MNKLNIVILAAGMGKRMQSSVPKVLHKLGGKPLLRHVIDTARALSPLKICIVHGYGGEMVREQITDEDIIWVEQAEQLGTGHALMQALPTMDQACSTLVLFGDVPLVKVSTLQELIDTSFDACGLLTANLEIPKGYGRIIRAGESNNVIAIVEEKDATDEQKQIAEINTGVMVVPNRYFLEWLPNLKNANQQKEYYLTDIISMSVQNNVSVTTVQPTNDWEISGVNSKVQLESLERVYQGEIARKLLEQGVGLIDASRIDIRGQLDCGRDVEIDVNCIFEGNVVLGDNVTILANNCLKNVTVAAGTTIAANSLIEDAMIGENCKIGPYARIRPGTKLADKVHIGNFVEIKNSAIAAGSKASHLSYIGDTEMGQNVNVGAGTITCNYDGVNKHKTIIKDNVFIGSDTQFIATVTVSEGATIGAGSTITRDVSQGQLTLSRVKQTSVAGWKRPVKKQ